ncbi:hypothetical protein [Streptomyces sp. NPDC001678]|uniref:hypothetical protein n=1 Tax=Streptomyces sp. NPDC001678 TaxID=3364599 RepID=UPI00368B3315
MSGLETADHVSVHLTGCGQEDASTVFGALEAAFPEVSGPEEKASAGAAAKGGATVWCMVVDARTRATPRAVAPARLAAPVTVDLFGAADPVRQVKEELGVVFGVEDHGTVPGEHELEVRLQLGSHPDA